MRRQNRSLWNGWISFKEVKRLRKAIRILSSSRPTPPRFCDVIIAGGEVLLEVKTERHRYERIPWEEMKYQVNAAIKMAANG